MSFYSYFSFAATTWFYGKKVGQLSIANSRIQKKTQMSKKPTTNEKLQFALTHTPSPQNCQIEISRHSWTPLHRLRYNKKTNKPSRQNFPQTCIEIDSE